MLVIPAIDLSGGACVVSSAAIRERLGSTTAIPSRVRDRSSSPALAACTSSISTPPSGTVRTSPCSMAICRAVDVPVQSGGGIRSLERAERVLGAGATEIILGTMMSEDERLARRIAERFAGRVIAGIDARGSHVATHGWRERAPVARDALVARVAAWGVARVVFTEIRRDGMGEGFDIEALAAVAEAANVKITASGGARTLEDVALPGSCIAAGGRLVHRRERPLIKGPSISPRLLRLRERAAGNGAVGGRADQRDVFCEYAVGVVRLRRTPRIAARAAVPPRRSTGRGGASRCR